MIPRFSLRRASVLILLGLAPLAALGVPGAAQTQTSAPAADPAYSDLYAAMQASVDQEQIVSGALAVLAREFAATPEFAGAEAVSPGLIEEITAGLRPVFAAQSERVRLLYRPSTIALFARSLSPAEAGDIAAFYRSDLGRKLMGNLSQTYAPEQTLANIQDGAPVTRDQVAADIGRATTAALSSLTEDDLAALGQLAETKPALLKLNAISNGVQEIRVQMENEPLTAEEDAAVVAVVEDVFTRRFGEN